jgi:uncharacterized protein (DUF362 family)/Pyruvate/2-oxoacid:ferredoxin oxidoreductase delta subunit
MERMGKGLIQKGAGVLIKPNLLIPAKPHQAVTTHPLVVRAAAEYALDQGARVQISDSPGSGTFKKLLKEGGYQEALNGLDVIIKPFDSTLKKDIGEPFGRIDLAKDVLEADVVINLPKLKTHSQMLLTLGVKNLFGCVVGLQKPEWHLRAGVDRDMFARLLVSIYKTIHPHLTLIDGILAMEGHGPGKSGTPRRLGVLAASRNAPALDLAVCQMLGVNPAGFPTHKAAKDIGLIGDRVGIAGDYNRVDHFNLPELGSLTFGPKPFHKLMRKHLVQRPVSDVRLCKQCGECWRYCPAQAITSDKKSLAFDYDACIRCYCCIEICPYGALRAAETPAGRMIRRIWRH